MRISDWSSDVCSSDLGEGRTDAAEQSVGLERLRQVASAPRLQGARANRLVGIGGDEDGWDRCAHCDQVTVQLEPGHAGHPHVRDQTGRLPQMTGFPIGRASWRERVCPYV